MTYRSNLVLRHGPEKQPSARLRDLSDSYRVASDALQIAADHGCTGALYDALFALCQREADAYEAKAAR